MSFYFILELENIDFLESIQKFTGGICFQYIFNLRALFINNGLFIVKSVFHHKYIVVSLTSHHILSDRLSQLFRYLYL